MQLLFISSNSSFNKCLRESTFVHSFSNEQSCTTNPYTDCSSMQGITILTSTNYSFRSCSWADCQSSAEAGAITFRDKTTNHLKVKTSNFIRCTSAATDYSQSAGAICAYNVCSISVSSSSFISCESTYRNGGGLCMYYILQQPYITNCDFISCFAFDDGGGV